MAVTIKHDKGKADESVTPTGTANLICYGPPPSGAANHKGVFVQQSATVYRFLGEELWTPGTASPSSYTYAG